MPEFIVSWSAYGPSGRLQASSQSEATRSIQEHLWAMGLEATVHYDRTMPGLGEWEGDFIILKSLVKRYGDMASFGVCVYEVGQRSFYDAQREVLELQRMQEASHAT